LLKINNLRLYIFS